MAGTRWPIAKQADKAGHADTPDRDHAATADDAAAVHGSGPWYAGQKLHVMGDCTLSMSHAAAMGAAGFSWELAASNSVWGGGGDGEGGGGDGGGGGGDGGGGGGD